MTRPPGIDRFSKVPESPKKQEEPAQNPTVEKTKAVSYPLLALIASIFLAVASGFVWFVTFEWLRGSNQEEEIPPKVKQGLKEIREGKLDKSHSAQDFIKRNFDEAFGEKTQFKPIEALEQEYGTMVQLDYQWHALKQAIEELESKPGRTEHDEAVLNQKKQERAKLLEKCPDFEALRERFESLSGVEELHQIFPGPLTRNHLRALPVISQLKRDIEERRINAYVVVGTKENGEKIYAKFTSVVALGKLIRNTFSNLSTFEQIKRIALFQQSFVADEAIALSRHLGIIKKEGEEKEIQDSMKIPYIIRQNKAERQPFIFDPETQQLAFSYSYFVEKSDIEAPGPDKLSDRIRAETIIDLKNPESETSVQRFTIESDQTEKVKTTAAQALRLPEKQLTQKLQEAFLSGEEAIVGDELDSLKLVSENFKSIVPPEVKPRSERLQRTVPSLAAQPTKTSKLLVQERISSDISREKIYYGNEEIESFERLEEIVGKENQEILALFHQGLFFDGMNAVQAALGEKYSVTENREEDIPTFKVSRSKRKIVGNFSYRVYDYNGRVQTKLRAIVRYEMIIDLEKPEDSTHKFTFEPL